MSGMANIAKTLRYMKRNGINNTYYAAKERMEMRASSHYSYEAPDDAELAKQRKETSDLAGCPSITMVIPAYNPDERFFREALSSVIRQSYPHWKLVIADASDTGTAKKWADKCASEPRIRYVKIRRNKGISDNTNAGIEAAMNDPSGDKCDFIGFMDHDDVLAPDALYHMAMAIMKADPVLLYSDEDKMYENSKHAKFYFDPHRKYDFNYDLLLTNNYICHLMLVRTSLLEKIRFRSEYDGAQDYDLVLQTVLSLINESGVRTVDLDRYIVHVPRILYHWRSHRESTSTNTASKEYAYEAGLRALTKAVNVLYKPVIYRDNSYPNIRHSKHLGFYDVDWGNEETIFKLRPDVGAIVGRNIDKRGRMRACIADRKGNWLYEGIRKHYAGEFNRFDCNQDVFMAVKKAMKVRIELQKQLDDSTDDMKFAREIRELGYLILYLPREFK